MGVQHRSSENQITSSLAATAQTTTITKKLTKHLLNKVSEEVTRINDPEIPGFHVRLGRVNKHGVRSKAFYLYYRTKTKPVKSVNYRIGGMPEIDIETAKSMARENLEKVRNGIDIQVEREKLSSGGNAWTVGKLYSEFFRNKILGRKRPEIVEASFNKDILPRVGHVLLTNITRHQLHEDVFSPILDRGAKSQAGKTLALLKQMFSYGVAIGCMDFNPLEGASKSTYAKYTPRRRTPSVDELRTALKVFLSAGMSIQNFNCFKVILLSGVRSGAAITAKWSDVDFEKRVWYAVNEKHSTRGEVVYQKVPMSDELLKAFRDQESHSALLKSEFVFPAKRNSVSAGKSISHMDTKTLNRSLNRIRKKGEVQIPDFQPHDIRRSIRSHLISVKSDSSSGRYNAFSPACAEKILGHSLSGMERVYDQHDYFDEMKEALSYWGSLFSDLI
ncbi:hypothetical protein CWC33_12340 [Idiomarina sp. X4]|uniref:tyrosine-type recombinase/integrase n=1 Tax=Idiomarina sp. X4 TaxID=2055892 RepID=UPI000C28A996|nr:integrase family protein [Idiomarina sp. X4]ATZ74438.1 hypothetical protein CWC33_12340 [Idiomarina sp. X4]